jgi:creatinine amidohydrolase/Fe(II)-dependent formamide hydrolase-like protein
MNRTLTLVLVGVVVSLSVGSPAAAEPPGRMVSPGVARSGPTDPLKGRWDDPKPAREITDGVDESTPHVVMPAEAAPARKRLVRAEFMNSSQVAAYFRRGGDMAILPVGGQAAAGDLPCGAESFNAHAAAVLVAERCNALAFPPIPYSYAGPQRGLPGTVSLTLEATLEYTQQAVESLYECGFKRVVLVGPPSMRDHLEALACRLYRDQRKLIVAGSLDLLPDTDEVKAALGVEPGEELRTLASLAVLGYPDVFAPGAVLRPAPEGPVVSSEVLDRMGRLSVGTMTPQGAVAAGPRVRGDIRPEHVARAIGVMRHEARRRDGLDEVYARYIDQMADWEALAPHSAAGWDKGVAACRYDAIPEGDLTPVVPGPGLPTDDVRVPLVQLPEEARPASLRRYRAEFMSAAEMAERMKDDPIAILPCGAFEMHGPHGLLGTDTFEAHSEAVMLARATGGIAFPPIFYTYAGATERYPGSVSPSNVDTVRYVKAVVRGLLDAGFRRVCILWVHGPGGQMRTMVIHDLYHETGQVVFAQRVRLFGGIDRVLGYGAGEDIRTLVGLKILGHPGVFVVDEPEDIGVLKLSFHTLVEMRRMGVRPTWFMGLPTQHLPVRKCVRTGDDEKLLPLMRDNAKAYADVPQAMDEFLKEIARLRGQ